MSEAVSALNGAEFDGIAQVQEAGLHGMITLRGDFTDKAFIAGLKKATGMAVPGQRLVISHKELTLAWMSSDELLLVLPYDAAIDMEQTLHAALSKTHAMAQNVSDARAVFTVRGAHARDVLAKVAPVDFSPNAFAPGMIRRTRLAQIAAAFWMVNDDTFQVICFRSVAGYAFDVLNSAAATGSEVYDLG